MVDKISSDYQEHYLKKKAPQNHLASDEYELEGAKEEESENWLDGRSGSDCMGESPVDADVIYGGIRGQYIMNSSQKNVKPNSSKVS